MRDIVREKYAELAKAGGQGCGCGSGCGTNDPISKDLYDQVQASEDAIAPEVDGKIYSAFVRATKPS
jgi:hypothetical protein